ncbi:MULTISPECIES: hypothetical protein [Ramlibacter]|uniref:Uncharacterized protein n=1 Tax=Ramlibacter aquaticus TaxID=2780094 RepID=A0ABR9SKJ4_9BURK|nr:MULTISPECIES: hypothetical protein [Ramlibacter]MBE7942409.1 hypothetical protein [Ramlibacter aquaticus]
MTQSEHLSAWNEAHARLARAEEHALALRLHQPGGPPAALLLEIDELRTRVRALFEGLADLLVHPCACSTLHH